MLNTAIGKQLYRSNNAMSSTDVAQELGIDRSRWVYLHGYSCVKERDIMSREDLGASPAARLACREALSAAHVNIDDVALFDLYSCFPIAVFNICDGLGLSSQDPRGLTVTGGLPYFGGPGNSYSTHAIASMVEQLRERDGAFGFVGANGGHMSKYAVGIYSTRPAEFVRCDSTALQAQVDSWPAPSTAGEADGPATIESYTVAHGKNGPSHAVVVGRLDGTGKADEIADRVRDRRRRQGADSRVCTPAVARPGCGSGHPRPTVAGMSAVGPRQRSSPGGGGAQRRLRGSH